MIKIAVVSTKGGVGKTTTSANLGALLAEMGMRVLLIDADTQPSLSKIFDIHQAKNGISNVMMNASITSDDISTVDIDFDTGCLDLITSDSADGSLGNWLINRADRLYRLQAPLSNPELADLYDIVIIDTPGAVGPLLDSAILAADILISPVVTETVAAREFEQGTIALLDRFECLPSLRLPPIKVVLYRQDRTNDAKQVADYIRGAHLRLKGRVEVLDTVVPHSKAYKEAATKRLPVHRHDFKGGASTPCASEVFHNLVYELFPNLALAGIRSGWEVRS